MKHTFKIMGIITIASIIAFSFIACDMDISRTTSDGFVYKGSSTLTITGYTGRAKNVSIPASINGKPVTAIGDHAFFQKQLTSLTIPSSVSSIGWGTFLDNQLTSVDLGSGIKTIGNYAFERNQLTSITIPNSVTSIGVWAFAENQLTSVTIPNSVTSIGHNAFTDNPSINLLFASDNTAFVFKDFFLLSKDEKHLISYYGSEESITIHDNVTSIGIMTFYKCQLTSVIIPDSVISIEDSAFLDNQLTDVILPDNVTSIGVSAFERNQLTSITIPDSVTSIGVSAFERNQLTSITIGANVTLQSSFSNSFGHIGAFDNGFDNAYNSNGRLAGTYTKNGNIWTIQ